MSYFKPKYTRINLPIQEGDSLGLRNAQLGAIHSIGSHFTLYKNEPAMVVMPTGSGKTAVLILSAFLLRAKRVLVISSNVLVRGQIVEEFETLKTLKNSNVFHRDLETPRVKEIKGPINSREEWDELAQYDVVVGIPNSINAGINNTFSPDQELFDLVLVDEAHHVPAFTWNNTITAFPDAKKIYFTATPFRRDRKEIIGKIAFNYPLSKAYEDGIFGDIGFFAVKETNGPNKDLAIAKKTEEIFNADREAGLDHYLLVRTESKDHADKLVQLYADETSLNLKKIHSGLSFSTIKKTIEKLKNKELDGIICVNMLGEGFDFPNLKIAAIHTPHKSLAATLQFLGRFARTNAENIGSAKFIAIEYDIRIGNTQLYQEDAVWNEAIRNLSEERIFEEDKVKEVLDTFTKSADEDEDISEKLSIYNLAPFCHVKIFKVEEFNIDGEISIFNHEVLHHFKSESKSTAVLVTKESNKPKWMISDDLVNIKYNIFLIYYSETTKLLFIHSSIKTPQIYNEIGAEFSNNNFTVVSKDQIHKVLAELRNTRIFNLGLQSRSSSNGESYITKAGPDTQNSVSPSDGRLYANGHVYGTAETDDGLITIGYSSGSKVWSNSYQQLPNFIEWCDKLGEKIISDAVVKTNTGFDFIPVGKVIEKLPENCLPYAATWNKDTFSDNLEVIVRQEDEILHCHRFSELSIIINREDCTEDKIALDVTSDSFTIPIDFTFEHHFRVRGAHNVDFEVVLNNGDPESLCDYLNGFPLQFYMTDFSTLVNHNELIESTLEEELPFDRSQIIEFPWEDYNTDITKEFGEIKGSKVSIHTALENHLKNEEVDILIYDHGNGETADFVSIKENSYDIKINLYHVKGSGGLTPGDRVDDLYEVCGQAVKSLIWTTSRNAFKRKIQLRTDNNEEKFLIGNLANFNDIIDKQKVLKFSITIVQPGISKNSFTGKLATLLASTDDFIRKNGNNEVLRILGSKSADSAIQTVMKIA